MHPQPEDLQLMKRIASNDQQAFRAIYRKYGKPIYSLAYHILQNTMLAEEVTQDTFVKVWRHKAQWDPTKGDLKNWLLAIAHFTAIDRLRQERRQPALHPDPIEELEDMGLDVPLTPRETAWQEDIALQALVSQLPKEQASLIDLAFFRGMSHSEIASEVGLPLGTVKTRLRTGLQRLRALWLESMKETPTRL